MSENWAWSKHQYGTRPRLIASTAMRRGCPYCSMFRVNVSARRTPASRRNDAATKPRHRGWKRRRRRSHPGREEQTERRIAPVEKLLGRGAGGSTVPSSPRIFGTEVIRAQRLIRQGRRQRRGLNGLVVDPLAESPPARPGMQAEGIAAALPPAHPGRSPCCQVGIFSVCPDWITARQSLRNLN